MEEMCHQPHVIVVQIHEDELHGQDTGKDKRATQRRNEHKLYMQQVGSYLPVCVRKESCQNTAARKPT